MELYLPCVYYLEINVEVFRGEKYIQIYIYSICVYDFITSEKRKSENEEYMANFYKFI